MPGGPAGENQGEVVQGMINRGFNSTKDSIDVIRNEVEVERLELLTQSQLIEQQKSELAFE